MVYYTKKKKNMTTSPNNKINAIKKVFQINDDIDVNKDIQSDSQYTVEGLRLWLNNKPKQSQEHFKIKIDSTPVFAGYTFILCMVSAFVVSL